MRIALLVDPLTYRVKGGSHAPPLARELTRRGHRVRLYGAPLELRNAREQDEDDTSGLRDFAPEWVVAYDDLSPTAWRGAKSARRDGSRLLLVETGRDAKDIPTHERALRALGERLWGRSVREAAWPGRMVLVVAGFLQRPRPAAVPPKLCLRAAGRHSGKEPH